MASLLVRLLLFLALALAGALSLPSTAEAQCRTPGQTCGLFGGSCCSGSSCVIGFCVADCAGDGGLCLSNAGCCDSRVCALGFCQTPRTLGQACGPGFPCASSLNCDPLAGFVCVDNADLGEACGPLLQCNAGLVCDPFAGFVCVDQSAQIGEACGPLVQCAGGLVCDPLAGFVCVDQSAGLGQACGPLVQCNAGLVCDPLAGFVCVDQSVGEDEACGPGVGCEAGLQCSLALRCSNVPGRAGETCDVTAPCGDGLFCQAGVPQRCQEFKKPGEGCSAFNPCVEGASCQPCFVEGCSAPLQCFPNSIECRRTSEVGHLSTGSALNARSLGRPDDGNRRPHDPHGAGETLGSGESGAEPLRAPAVPRHVLRRGGEHERLCLFPPPTRLQGGPSAQRVVVPQPRETLEVAIVRVEVGPGTRSRAQRGACRSDVQMTPKTRTDKSLGDVGAY